MNASSSRPSPHSRETGSSLSGRLYYPAWLAGSILAGIFLVTRFLNLAALPIFVDEGIHLSWAQVMWTSGDFLHGTAAGKFLHIWLLALATAWTPNPLLAARALSGLIGLLGGLATICLANTLWPHSKLAWVVAPIYLFLPLPLVTERLVLVDSLLTLLTTLILILSLGLVRQPRRLTTFALGLCLGLAYLTKLSGLIYLLIPLLAFVLAPEGKQSARVLIGPYLIAFLVALPTASELLGQFVSEAIRSIVSPLGSEVPDAHWRLYGLGETWIDLLTYVTWPILLLAAVSLVHGLRAKERGMRLVGALLLLTPSVYVLLARDVWYSRYLLPIVPLIVVLAARSLAHLAALLAEYTGVARGRVWLASLSALCLVPGLIFDYKLITDPAQAPLAPTDRWQYVTGWPSGYGLPEAATWIQKKAAEEGPLLVITDVHSGPTREGIRLHLANEPDIRLLSLNLGSSLAHEELHHLVQAQPGPLLLFLNLPADQSWDFSDSPCPTPLAVFPKPDDHSQLMLKLCSASP
jgi:4-amino-4-deoxy-L-arabinose transferase-like glycosyltransferase